MISINSICEMNTLVILICNFMLIVPYYVNTQRYRTIYQYIQEDPELNGFNILLKNNNIAKRNLYFDEVTVFAPDNGAFHDYKDELYPDLAYYHISYKLQSIQELNASTSVIKTVIEENPPLWITRVNNQIFINNAKIIKSKSNKQFRTQLGDDGKRQILHSIDEVLNPMIRLAQFSPNAFDFISSSYKWDLGATKSVSSFYTKVQENNLEYVFKQNAGHTFFVPLDSGIDAYKFKQLNKHIILGHIIPYYVLFTKPTSRNLSHESLANDDYLYIVLSFVEIESKLFVKGIQRGTVGNRYAMEEFYSEIIVPNIPVKNGVIHLISQPLAIFNRTLKPFPYLPIQSKLSNDPNLETFYTMGEDTDFNTIFDREGVRFTYFVPTDSSWKKSKEMDLIPVEDDLKILKRHLVISETPFSIEQLEALTKSVNNTYVELINEEGILRIMVLKIDGEYYLKWFNKYIKIIRPNYECTNGIIHILAGPMVSFRKKQDLSAHSPSNMDISSLNLMKNAFDKFIYG